MTIREVGRSSSSPIHRASVSSCPVVALSYRAVVDRRDIGVPMRNQPLAAVFAPVDVRDAQRVGAGSPSTFTRLCSYPTV